MGAFTRRFSAPFDADQRSLASSINVFFPYGREGSSLFIYFSVALFSGSFFPPSISKNTTLTSFSSLLVTIFQLLKSYGNMAR